jgi:hypothetical protein
MTLPSLGEIIPLLGFLLPPRQAMVRRQVLKAQKLLVRTQQGSAEISLKISSLIKSKLLGFGENWD